MMSTYHTPGPELTLNIDYSLPPNLWGDIILIPILQLRKMRLIEDDRRQSVHGKTWAHTLGVCLNP